MSRSPSRFRADYTEYEFTASTGFDYNYDPLGTGNGTLLHADQSFDPYADNYLDPQVNQPFRNGYSQEYKQYGYSERAEPYSPKRHQFPARPLSVDSTAVKPVSLPLDPPPQTPTVDYIRESEKPSYPLEDPSSSRKLLILDLNGTLLFRSPHIRREPHSRYRRNYRDRTTTNQNSVWDPYADPTAARPLRTVYARPYLASFKQYLFHRRTRQWLDTMVWSSAQPHSVADMVEKCFGEKKDDLVAIWARDTLGLEEKDYYRKTQTTKDLAKPWAALPLLTTNSTTASTAVPLQTGQLHSARTTILLDDSPLKAHLQPWNHLCIREYVAELRQADLVFRSIELNRSSAKPQPNDDEGQDGAGAEVSGLDIAESGLVRAAQGRGVDGGEPRDGAGRSGEVDRAEVTVGNKRKRKRPKKGSRAMQTYDQTLLAVIGILDNISGESNVAGWMRSGGLGRGGAADKGKEKVQGDTESSGAESDCAWSEDVDGESEHGNAKKARRISDGQNEERDGSLPSADTIQVKSPSPDASSIDARHTKPPDASGSTDDVIQWYDNISTMRYWVERGIQALENLGIETISGVDV